MKISQTIAKTPTLSVHKKTDRGMLEELAWKASNPALYDVFENPSGNPQAKLAVTRSLNDKFQTELAITRLNGDKSVAAVAVVEQALGEGRPFEPSTLQSENTDWHDRNIYELVGTVPLEAETTVATIADMYSSYIVVPLGKDGNPVGHALGIGTYSQGTADPADPFQGNFREPKLERVAGRRHGDALGSL
jgi:hypothetical protein